MQFWRRLALALPLLLAISSQAHATVRYLDGQSGSDSYDCSAATHTTGSVGPCKTHYHMLSIQRAGDTIRVMDAVYPHFAIIEQSSTVFGTADKPIYWVGADRSGNALTPPAVPTMYNVPTNFPFIHIENGASTTLALQIKHNNRGSTSAPPTTVSTAPLYMVFQNIGFSASASTDSNGNATCDSNNKSAIYVDTSSHVTFDHDIIYCGGGSGYGSEAAQYVTLSNNWIYENAHAVYGGSSGNYYCVYGSGSSTLRTYDWDNVTNNNTQVSSDYTEVIKGNAYWNNYNNPSTAPSGLTCNPTDGNSHIYDRNDGSIEADLGDLPTTDPGGGGQTSLPKYYGKMLFANNIVYDGGGPCMHSYRTSGPIDVLNNTCYHNNHVTTNVGSSNGEINFLYSDGSISGAVMRAENNITVTTGKKMGTRQLYCFQDLQRQSGMPKMIFKNNLCYDESGGGHNYKIDVATSSGLYPNIVSTVYGNPLLNAPTDDSTADFRIKSGSPAVGMNATAGEFVSPDIAGTARTAGNVTAGAYQNTVGTTTPPVTPPPSGTISGSGVARGPFAYTYTSLRYDPNVTTTGTGSGTNYRNGNEADVVVPAPTGSQWTGPYPAIIIVHGGGWYSGYRDYDLPQCADWASYGFVCMNIDYRLQSCAMTGRNESPGYGSTTCLDQGCVTSCQAWPAQGIDILHAIRWLRGNATTYHVDTAQVGCKGDSAGASMCMDAGFYGADKWGNGTTDAGDTQYSAQKGNATFVVSEFGPTDAAKSYASQPPLVVDLVTKNAATSPPVMLVQGTTDTSSPVSDADATYNTLNNNCRTVKYVKYTGGHEFSNVTGTPTTNGVRTSEIIWASNLMKALGYSTEVPTPVN